MPYDAIQSALLTDYLKYQGSGSPGVDFDVVKAFTDNGANPTSNPVSKFLQEFDQEFDALSSLTHLTHGVL